MQFSAFGEKFTQHSGILQLMDDLGDALKSDKPVNMLGGGNPARIAEVNAVFADVFSKLAAEHAVENIGNYSNPQGDAALIAALTKFLNREYGWNLTADNIALTNGSQTRFSICLTCSAANSIFQTAKRLKKLFCCRLRLNISVMRTCMSRGSILFR